MGGSGPIRTMSPPSSSRCGGHSSEVFDHDEGTLASACVPSTLVAGPVAERDLEHRGSGEAVCEPLRADDAEVGRLLVPLAIGIEQIAQRDASETTRLQHV